MKARFMILFAAAGVLGACKDFTSGTTFVCKTQAPTVASTQGDTVTTNVGVRYVETLAGTGAAADVCQDVTINYTLYVKGNATPFDASTNAGRGPLTFISGGGSLNIVGVDVGVVGMKVGGKRRLIIPPNLAYGSTVVQDTQGNVVVPAGSTIIADIELTNVGDKH